jgi:5-methylcytosine-specific restriction endonuclease McrA
MNRSFSKNQRRLLLWLSAGFCQLCGKRLYESFHADHIKPHSKGGTTTTRNGQALCPPCNLRKGSKWN